MCICLPCQGYGHGGSGEAGIRLHLQRPAACDDAKQGTASVCPPTQPTQIQSILSTEREAPEIFFPS